MFPGLTRAGDDIVLSFSTVPDGWPGGRVGVIRSSDEGSSWSEPTWVAEPDDTYDAALSAVSLATAPNGRLLLPYNKVTWSDGGVNGRRLAAAIVSSVDGGRTWQADTRVEGSFFGPCVYGKIVSTDDARLLWPVWGQRAPEERWRSELFESRDNGRSFAPLATIGYDPDARLAGEYVHPQVGGIDAEGKPSVEVTSDPDFRPHASTDGFSETSVLVLPGGELVAVLRQQGVGGDGGLLLFGSRSTDGGATWTPPRSLRFSGMSPSLHLMNGGTPVLAYRRHAPVGGEVLPGVEIRVGDVSASNWGAPVPLVDPHGYQPTAEYQCGYPALVDGGSDSVFVVFYSYRPEHGRYLAGNWLTLIPDHRHDEPVLTRPLPAGH